MISCLMVTKPVPDRFERMKRSVADYLRQTHANRELVMVIDGRVAEPTTAAIRAHVASLGRSDIRLAEPAGAASLGALRNVSLGEARGEVVCLWDDDDLHHPDRLARQLATLVEADAETLALRHTMQFVERERLLYCVNWARTEAKALPATLMWRAPAPVVYPETGPEAHLGEDVVVALQLQARGGYRVLADEPALYVYVSHGANTYDVAHHQGLLSLLALSKGLLLRREAALREALAAHDFGPGSVTVQGANGPAFVIG